MLEDRYKGKNLGKPKGARDSLHLCNREGEPTTPSSASRVYLRERTPKPLSVKSNSAPMACRIANPSDLHPCSRVRTPMQDFMAGLLTLHVNASYQL